MSTERYTGKYQRLFPIKTSVNSFIMLYTMHLLDKKGAMHGKELIDAMAQRFGGTWSPSHGMVYPILNELEEKGVLRGVWMKGYGNRQIKQYHLTPAGQNIYNLEKSYLEKDFLESLNIIETFMVDIYDTEMLDLTV